MMRRNTPKCLHHSARRPCGLAGLLASDYASQDISVLGASQSRTGIFVPVPGQHLGLNSRRRFALVLLLQKQRCCSDRPTSGGVHDSFTLRGALQPAWSTYPWNTGRPTFVTMLFRLTWSVALVGLSLSATAEEVEPRGYQSANLYHSKGVHDIVYTTVTPCPVTKTYTTTGR